MVEGHFRPFLPLDLCGAPSPHSLIHSGLFLRLCLRLRLGRSHSQREVFRFQASSMTALRWPTGKSIRELRIGACAMLSTCPRGPRGGVIGWLVRHVSRNPAFPVGCSKCPCRGPRFWVLGQIAHARQKGVLHRIFVCLIGFRSHHPSQPLHQATFCRLLRPATPHSPAEMRKSQLSHVRERRSAVPRPLADLRLSNPRVAVILRSIQ